MATGTKTIDELYIGLCVELRELAKGSEAKTWKCLNCGKSEDKHGGGMHGRCSCSAITTEFRAAETKRVETVRQALGLIDQILELKL